MNKKYIALLLIFPLLSVSLFIGKVNAEAPEPLIVIPVVIQQDDIKSYAYTQIVTKFGADNWESFKSIIEKESKWKCNAQNPHSTAYGLGQLLNSTWKLTSYKKSDDCYIQLDATIEYIQKVYKTPNNAWKFWKSNNWY